MEDRMKELERWKGQMETRVAILENDVNTMKDYLLDIKDNTKWALRWVVGGFTSLGLLVVSFLLSATGGG